MTQSSFVATLDDVQRRLAAFLKPRGYRKRGRTFNRQTADGLMQVINLQMGEYPVGNPVEVPPIRLNLYGKFTINLGVFVPELYSLPRKEGAVVREYECAIRARLGDFVHPPHDRWWDLSQDAGQLADEIVPLLDSLGLPFLDHFGCRDSVIWDWIAYNEKHSLSRVARVDVARLLVLRGDRTQAHALLNEQRWSREIPPAHASYLDDLAAQLGLDTLQPATE